MHTATRNAIMILIVTPTCPNVNIPFIKPVNPPFWNPSYEPLNNKCPKFVIGIVAPAPPQLLLIMC